MTTSMRNATRCCLLGLLLLPIGATQVPAQPPGVTAENQRPDDQLTPLPPALKELIAGSTPLNPQNTVLLNLNKKRVFLHTEVSCRDCVLEMLCVPKGRKEHETILNVRTPALTVHSALLALGLKPGQPAEFYPDYKAPAGPIINLFVNWVDKNGRLQRQDARSWIRHSINRYFSHPLAQAPPGVKLPHQELRYDSYNKELIWYGPMSPKQRDHLLTLWDNQDYQTAIGEFFRQSQSRPMTAEFVFTGSTWQTFDNGERVYAAEDGQLITVANFSTSTIDVAEASSASQGGELYEGWEQRIPPERTPVLLEIQSAGRSVARTRQPADKDKAAGPADQATPAPQAPTP